MLSRENGKLLRETTWEVALAVDWLRYSAASALTQVAGRAAEPTPGLYFQSVPEAAGVAGIISPWNSPIVLTVRAIGPALGAGCTVVVKLPGQTALTNALLGEVVEETTSVPSAVVSPLTEAGNEVAPLLLSSPAVDVVSYTGSTEVGRAIAAAAAPTVKRLSLELGGKTPLIVFDDADIDSLLPLLVGACTLMNGQFCVTGSRVLVHRAVADEVRAKLSASLQSVQVGPANDPASQLGPLIDKAAVERVDKLVEEATSYAKVLVRGGPLEDPALEAGAFYRPSLLEIEELNAPLVQQEVFGPAQTFEVFDDEADAIRRANATDYGLAASVFTRNDLPLVRPDMVVARSGDASPPTSGPCRDRSWAGAARCSGIGGNYPGLMTRTKNSERSGKAKGPTNRRGLVESEIYEHATRLFAEKGFASTTLQDIADALGVTRPAVYYYFKTKEAILARLVGEITQTSAADVHEIADRSDLAPAERLRRMTRLNVSRIAAQAARFRLLVKSESELPEEISHAHREARREVLSAFVRVVQDGIRSADFRPIDARTGALGVIGLCNWVAWWYHEGDDTDAVADTLAEMAVASLRRADERLPRERGTDGAIALLREDIDHLEQLLADQRKGG